MKIEEAVVGRWIHRTIDNARRKIIAVSKGHVCVEHPDGKLEIYLYLDQWELLPTECDSFDWLPETFPQYWTAVASDLEWNVSYVVRNTETRWTIHYKDGTTGRITTLHFNPEGRKRLTEAEALAMLDKPEPVESPDDWVTQDRVNYRVGDEIRWVLSDGTIHVDWGAIDFVRRELKHGAIVDGEYLLEVRCRRKDLPPLPEPAKPATRKVLLTEWYCKTQSGAVIYWSENTPVGYESFHAIGTREIEVPL